MLTRENGVRSEPLKTETARKLPPLPRDWIDDVLPVARALIGATFVAFSSYATVTLFGNDIRPIVGDVLTIGGMLDRYWLGVALALALFVGEIITAEHAPAIYGAILIPDTYYTARQMIGGIERFLAAYGAIGGGILAALTVWGLLLAEGRSGRWALLGGIVGGLCAWGIMGALATPWMSTGAAWVFAGLDGYLIARFGETLLFGRRRK
jgi:hypothetical protein